MGQLCEYWKRIQGIIKLPVRRRKLYPKKLCTVLFRRISLASWSEKDLRGKVFDYVRRSLLLFLETLRVDFRR